MRRALIVANWKMNATLAGIRPWLSTMRAAPAARCETAVCPSFPYLAEVAAGLGEDGPRLGAQDVSAHPGGAHTGEVSAAMLCDYNCHYVIVGHSERRHEGGEDHAVVAAKFAAVQAAGMTPILCVGELREQREQGATQAIIGAQLQAIAGGPAALRGAVIAYEPVWAIGSGASATPEQAQEVHACIRAWLHDSDAEAARQARILYGGSVQAENAGALFAMPDIDGGLIGGASLDAAGFLAIRRNLDKAMEQQTT